MVVVRVARGCASGACSITHHAHLFSRLILNPAVCLESEAAFEKEKGLVLKEYNHAKTSGKLTWKADKAGEFYFVDPDKCGKGMQLTVNVVDGKATAGAPAGSRRMLSVA